MRDLLPRIESTATGGIVLFFEVIDADIERSDLVAAQEDSYGLPEPLTDVMWAHKDSPSALLRLIAEYAAATYNAGFVEGRKAEREDWQGVKAAAEAVIAAVEGQARE